IGSVTTPLTANITPATLTVSGLSAQTKVYNATTAATLTGTASLAGLYGGDSVSLSGTASTGTFANKNVGVGKTVTANLSGLSLSGPDSGDYQIGSVTTPLTANITPATLAISGLSADNKVYDATTVATLRGTANLSGVYGGDSVSFNGAVTGVFGDKNVGSGKTVTANLNNFSLSGADSSNYQVGSVTTPLTANITPATLTVSGLSAQDKVYNATTSATLTGTASLAGLHSSDSVSLSGSANSGSFVDKNVGTGKTVTANLSSLSLSGTDAGNYQLGSTATPLTASITPATLTVSGLSAQNKVYDTTTAATLSGTATLGGLYNGDSVSLNGTANSGNFLDKNVGTNKTVTANLAALGLSGTDASDYQLGSVTSPLMGSITPATLTYVAMPVAMTSGTSAPSLSGTVTGFVGSDGVASATTGTLTFTTSAGSTASPGSYEIAGGGLTANNGNYVFAQSPANAQALAINGSSKAPSYFTNPTVSQPSTTPVVISGATTTPTLPSSQPGQKVGGLNYLYVAGSSADSSGGIVTTASTAGDHSTIGSSNATAQTTVVSANNPDVATDTRTAAAAPDAAAPTLPTSQAGRTAGGLNYVAVSETSADSSGNAVTAAGTGSDHSGPNLAQTTVVSSSTASGPTDTQQASDSSDKSTSTQHVALANRPARRAGVVDVVVVDGGINFTGRD
ncbi:MAG TPA: YDG domain-containing protein, partial [Steroidobacteraceae bacterium]